MDCRVQPERQVNVDCKDHPDHEGNAGRKGHPDPQVSVGCKDYLAQPARLERQVSTDCKAQ